MPRNAGNNYFEMLYSMAESSREAAAKLEAVLKRFDYAALDAGIKELSAIEHNGDFRRHMLVKKLAGEFITPIERGDIMDLAGQIDTVTDSIESVLLKIYMLNIKLIRPDVPELACLVEKCCVEMLNIMREFGGFRKSAAIWKFIAELNRLKEGGVKLYVAAVRNLCSARAEAAYITAWIEIYNSLEKCLKACENVADTAEAVIIKNT